MKSPAYLEKIQTLPEVLRRIGDWRAFGESIVFTNGCFDILHPGHADYLSKAATLGDRLVIGLNSDASVSSLKGDNRPIQSEYARASILAALSFTDLIIVFDATTPIKLITALMPDILVKGGDYLPENIVGYDVVTQSGGKVMTVDFLPGYSTSAIEEKIRRQG
jgi:rfaE bifunctional protein nucleotidyltransferase chain/domain